MAVRAVQIPVLTGVVAVSNAAAAGDQFAAGSTTRIRVTNTDASAHTVTPTVTKHVVAGDTVTFPATSIAAGTSQYLGPYPAEYFGDTSSPPLVSLAWSSTTGMSWEVTT